jgi:hypothetical protein
MHLHSYPKVYAIGHAAVAELFLEPVLVEEKVDGSQFSFGRVGDELAIRSKGAEIIATSNDAKMFSLGVATAQELAPILHDGWTYRCEYLQKPKHNVLCYERVPKGNVIVFDINTGDEVYLSREEKVAEAERLGLEFVPLMYEGMVSSPEQIYQFLERDSVLGGNKVEGIVAKNYLRFGRDKKVLMGKFVREDFKETHNKEWKAANPSVADIVERIIATIRSEKRWEKAMFHLRDAGELENSPRDIPKLIQAAQQDIRDEEIPFIQQKLLEWALPRIIRASTGGLPEWYKKHLLESAFPVEQP